MLSVKLLIHRVSICGEYLNRIFLNSSLSVFLIVLSYLCNWINIVLVSFSEKINLPVNFNLLIMGYMKMAETGGSVKMGPI
jgi:hypothetical protein